MKTLSRGHLLSVKGLVVQKRQWVVYSSTVSAFVTSGSLTKGAAPRVSLAWLIKLFQQLEDITS